MGEVIQLDRTASGPHLQGQARCLACRHEWQAVAPVGTDYLDCPKCGADGHMLGHVLREGRHWKCNCGWMHFLIHEGIGIYCPNCGVVQRW